jgi:ABC-type uncharacterized transport system permease subunit
MKFLSGYKTYLTGAAAILTALAGLASGTMDVPTAIQTTYTAILAMTVRHGIAKS